MKLCGRPARVHGAKGCPRRDGHRGEHYWWIPFEVGEWRVVVYAGEPKERRRVCRGVFTEQPSSQDVYRLMQTLGRVEAVRLKRREHARG